MALQLFVVPLVTNSSGMRVAKYLSGTAFGFSIHFFGVHNWCLAAVDPDTNLLNTLNAAADVHPFPVSFDVNLTAANLATATTKLESVGIPVADLDVGNTFRDLLRRIFKLADFYQLHGRLSRAALISGGITLDTTLASLSQNARDILKNAAAIMHINASQFSGSSTLRQVLVFIERSLPVYTMSLAGINL